MSKQCYWSSRARRKDWSVNSLRCWRCLVINTPNETPSKAHPSLALSASLSPVFWPLCLSFGLDTLPPKKNWLMLYRTLFVLCLAQSLFFPQHCVYCLPLSVCPSSLPVSPVSPVSLPLSLLITVFGFLSLCPCIFIAQPIYTISRHCLSSVAPLAEENRKPLLKSLQVEN